MAPNARSGRVVSLRAERDGADSRFLRAYLDEAGNLHIDGQDLGPATASVSSDGEYEWFETIQQADVPKVIALLDGSPEDDILDLLERGWTGDRAAELERRLRESDIHIQFSSWSG